MALVITVKALSSVLPKEKQREFERYYREYFVDGISTRRACDCCAISGGKQTKTDEKSQCD